jgi:hypothetical protein
MRPRWLLLLLALLARGSAVDAACTPSCRSGDAALAAATNMLRVATAGTAPDTRRRLLDADAAAEPPCHLKMHTREEAHHALSGTWIIMLGKSWTQAITFGMLQARSAAVAAVTRDAG